MKPIYILLSILWLFSCWDNSNSETRVVQHNNKTSETKEIDDNSILEQQDSFFKLDINIDENMVRVVAPDNSTFELPDSSTNAQPYKIADFNADNKEDILVYLGECGTGGCMYGLFINQYDNFYRLAYFDYLKNAVFNKEKNGFLTIQSSEELEPYNPSKIEVTVFKFDQKTYYYKFDTSYVNIDR